MGLDPGSRYTGFGIVQMTSQKDYPVHLTHGVLEMPSPLSFAAKLYSLSQKLNEIFLKWHPDEVIVEKIFLGPNVDTAFKLGHARGLCLAASAQYGSQLFEMATRSAKKAVTGYGGAGKEQVAMALSSWLHLNTKGIKDDATDALALAVARSLVWDSEQRLNQQKQSVNSLSPYHEVTT